MPAANAVGVETGAAVTAVFDRPIDPATLTPTTFLVTQGGVALPMVLTYDAVTRTALAVVPLLPDGSYQVEVTTGVRTPADSGLPASVTWTFATRRWQIVTVDVGGAGLYTSLKRDGTGRVHVTYYDAANGHLKYTTCAAGCTIAGSWEPVIVDVGNVGLYTSLAVGADARLHVTYWAEFTGALKYATCAADCAVGANWETGTIEAPGPMGLQTSLAVEGNGRLHLAYAAWDNGDLKYATCLVSCTIMSNWEKGVVDTPGVVGLHASLLIDGTGRLHVTYWDFTNGDLKYATCLAACAVAESWQAVTVDIEGTVGAFTSLAVDGSGRLHVTSFGTTNRDLRYATCATGCTTGASWEVVAVEPLSHIGSYGSLAVDRNGRLHVTYMHGADLDLKYATCVASCATAAHWRWKVVDPMGVAGLYTSLAVDPSGRAHVSYQAGGDLRYSE